MRTAWNIQLTDREVRAWRSGDPRAAIAWQPMEPPPAAPDPLPVLSVVRYPLEDNSQRLPIAALTLAIGQTLRHLTDRPARVRLILPSSWCYVHSLSIAQRRPTPAMLLFALEEFLPVDAEALVAEFLRGPPGQWIGVALEHRRVRPLLDALQAADIEVEAITIDVLECAARHDAPQVIWLDHDHAALLRRAARRTSQLEVVRFVAEPESADRWDPLAARVADLQNAKEARFVGGTRPAPEVLKEMSPHLSSVAQAEHAGLGEINFAQGPLAPAGRHTDTLRQWRRSAVAVLSLLLLLAGGLELRRTRLLAELQTVATWERQQFAAVFPNEPVPAGVALRLGSERRRLEGLTTPTLGTPGAEGDALELLRLLVRSIPGDLRLTLQEIRIDGNDVTLRGLTRDPGQAERLVQSLGPACGLQMNPPRTDRVREGGTQFLAQASRRAAVQKERP